MSKLGFAVLVVLQTAACASVKRPEIELIGVRVGGVGLRGATLIAELDVNNRNDFEITSDSISYQLLANTASSGTEQWQPVLQRTHTQRIVINEDDITRIEIPIEFNYTDLSGAARSILERGVFNYRLVGNAFVTEPLRRTIPFSRNGSVSLTSVR
jgi:LEA14-like dessication related protein